MKYNIKLDMSVGTSHSLILGRIQPESKVLEFGPASGYMTRYMNEELGCKIYGVEIDAEAARYAAKYTEKMIVGDIEDLKWYKMLIDEQFDVIIFADVLEHLRNPSHILKLVVSLLKDDGRIITSVPNISHNAIIMELMQGKFEYKPTGLLDETHIKFFTRNNVLKMLEYAGLSPEEWLVTQRRPETTEFTQDYRNFPLEVRKYLQSRPDGDVYQFITVSGKKDFVNNEKLFVGEHTNYLDSDFIQIFWGSRAAFSEEKSIRAVHQASKDIVNYKLEFPLGAQGEIRIDLSSELSCGEIHGIEIYSKDSNQVVYSWDREVTSLSYYDLSYTQHDNFIEFIVINNDPKLIINNFSLVESDINWCIEIKMKIKSDVTEILNYLIYNLDNHISQSRISKLVNENQMAINEEQKQRIKLLEDKVTNYDLKVSQYEQIERSVVNVLDMIKLQRIENVENVTGIINEVSQQFQQINGTSTKMLNDQSEIIHLQLDRITTSLDENKDELVHIKERINKPNILKRIYRKIVK